MTAASDSAALFQLLGKAAAHAQLFEISFVMAARLALKQANATTLEDVVPVHQPTALKQPVKAILKELGEAQSIDSQLEARISRLIDDRNRLVHRSFLEFGWPGEMTEAKEDEFVALCAKVEGESQILSVILQKMILTWLKRFPAASEVAHALETQFKEFYASVPVQP